MKKILAIFAVVAMSAAAPAFAATNYSRTGGQNASVSFSFTDWASEMNFSVPESNYWNIEAYGQVGFSAFSACYASTTVSGTSSFTFPTDPAEYPVQINVGVQNNLVDCGNAYSALASGYTGTDGDPGVSYDEIFPPGAPAIAPAFTISTSTGPTVLASVSSAFHVPGLLIVVGLGAGLPLAFYAIDQLIALFPDRRKQK